MDRLVVSGVSGRSLFGVKLRGQTEKGSNLAVNRCGQLSPERSRAGFYDWNRSCGTKCTFSFSVFSLISLALSGDHIHSPTMKPQTSDVGRETELKFFSDGQTCPTSMFCFSLPLTCPSLSQRSYRRDHKHILNHVRMRENKKTQQID